MSKLPVWADLIRESYPTPIDAPDNPGSFPVSEEEMTPAQKKRRETIVKAMKDREATFKHAYGPRWKDVMYATATKMAMQESSTPTFRIGQKVRVPHDGHMERGTISKIESGTSPSTSYYYVKIENGNTIKVSGDDIWEIVHETLTPRSPVLQKDARVRVPHKGKMVTGKVVRYDKGQDPHGSPFYVVDVGEYESLKVPVQKVIPENRTSASSGRHMTEGRLFGPGKDDAKEVIKEAIYIIGQFADYSDEMSKDGRGFHYSGQMGSLRRAVDVMKRVLTTYPFENVMQEGEDSEAPARTENGLEAGFFVRGPQHGGRPAKWWVDFLTSNGIPAKEGKSPYHNLVAVFVKQKDAKRAAAILFEDTGAAMNRIPAGGPGGFGAGNRSVGSESITFDVTSEAEESDDADTPKTSKTDTKKKAKAPETPYVLYRKVPGKGWSPHFRNFREDDTVESPVYANKTDAKAAERLAIFSSPDTVYYRVRPVTPEEADRIQLKFVAFEKKLMSEAAIPTPDVPVSAARDINVPLRLQAATVIYNALMGTKSGTKPTGTNPVDIINQAIKLWRNQPHTPEGWAIGAKMLKLADQMDIKWDRSLLSAISPTIKQRLGLDDTKVAENAPVPAANTAPASNQTQQNVSTASSQRSVAAPNPAPPAPATSQTAARPATPAPTTPAGRPATPAPATTPARPGQPVAANTTPQRR